jgi:nucleoprotein TPR
MYYVNWHFQCDRIDPAEMQSLKDEIEELKSQKAAVEAASQDTEEEQNKQAERVS